MVLLLLRSTYGEQFIRSMARGAVRERLLFKRLAQGSVTLPDWSSQECIARKLRLCQAACNKVDEAASVAGDLRAALPREVFGGVEAQKWPSVPLESIAEIVGGIQKSPDRAPTKFHYPFLTVRNVQHGYLDLTDTERFEVSPREFERLRLCKGDLLIVEGNGSLDQIGRNALFYENGDWIHQNHVIRVRLGRESSPEFVSLYLNSVFGRRQMIEKAKTTSGLYTLSVNKVGDLRVPAPNRQVQDAVVAGVRPRLALSDALVEALSTQAAALASMSTSLLSRSLSIELVHAES
jgi:type I restriction enzyme S subunit